MRLLCIFDSVRRLNILMTEENTCFFWSFCCIIKHTESGNTCAQACIPLPAGGTGIVYILHWDCKGTRRDERVKDFMIDLDYDGVLNLHKALLEAKFHLDPDNELVSGSPFVADVSIPEALHMRNW